MFECVMLVDFALHCTVFCTVCLAVEFVLLSEGHSVLCVP